MHFSSIADVTKSLLSSQFSADSSLDYQLNNVTAMSSAFQKLTLMFPKFPLKLHSLKNWFDIQRYDFQLLAKSLPDE